MKYVKKFATYNDYESAVESGLILPNVSLITENMATSFHSALFTTLNPRYLYSDMSVSTAYDNTKTVIGIEVVPASHTTNHQSRFMSVVNMSLKTPELGTTAVGNKVFDKEDDTSNPGAGIKWGPEYSVPNIFTPSATTKGLVYSSGTLLNELSSNAASFMATDDNTQSTVSLAYPNTFGPSGRYYFDDGTSNNKLPYPFTKYGKKNPLFAQKGSVTSDMNGFGNTQTMIAAMGNDDWTTGMVVNEVGSTADMTTLNFPPAAVCYRFNAGVGALTHKWYLPAMGELMYLFANLNEINAKLALLGSNNAVCVGYGNKSGATYPVSDLGQKLLSSTQSAANAFYGITTNAGGFGISLKVDSVSVNRVRAFISVPL